MKKEKEMEFIVCVANFIYDMCVCGRSSDSGCSGGMIVDTDVLARDIDGMFIQLDNKK